MVTVSVVVASYILFVPVALTVKVLTVILAVVEAVVLDKV